MANDKVYKRWIEDAEPWTPADDWDPSEYYQWCQRLTDARNKLKDTFKSVDEELIQEAVSTCEQFRDKDWPKDASMDDIAKAIVRYSIAYNFYVRRTFEDVGEKQSIARTQEHLGSLGIGMNDIDVAQMLQKAADKVPLKEAVKGTLVEFSKAANSGSSIATEWKKDVNTYYEFTDALIVKLANSKAPSKLEEFPKMVVKEAKEELPEAFQGPPLDRGSAKALKFFDTEERLRLFVLTRADPILPQLPNALQRETSVLDSVVNSKTLDSLLEKAISLEEDNLSWGATIGPAVTAIRRLGRRSAGKDAKSLADYAKDHAKPPH